MRINKENEEKIKSHPSIVSAQFEALGTEINIQIVVEDCGQKNSAKEDIQKARILYADFAKIFSRFDQESELSKLNKSLGVYNPASDHMFEIVVSSLMYNRKTAGLYDPRILGQLEAVGYAGDFRTTTRRVVEKNDEKVISLDRELSDDLKIDDGKVFFGVRMDFSGIAKGYITDKVSAFLIKKGWKNFLIDSGGDMFMCGLDENGKKWVIDVEGIDKGKLIFSLSNEGIATSGITRRKWEIEGRKMHHIINPKNPKNFMFELKSVSVVADSTMDCDVWAKALFLMGRQNAMVYAKEKGLAAVILDYRGTAWISPNAKKFVY